jgi:hypothetical protein
VCERLEDPVTSCHAYHLRARVAGEVADLEEVTRCIAAYERLAERLGQPLLGWTGLWYGTALALVSGVIPEADRLAGRILDAGQRTGQPDASVYWAFHLFDVRRDQGRLAEFEADLAAVVRDFPRLTILRAFSPSSCARSTRTPGLGRSSRRSAGCEPARDGAAASPPAPGRW